MAFSFGKMNDPDATLFVQASGITDSTQRGAIVDLVKDLKSNNLWSKMKAIYPFIGGTAATHKWNLKDPRDTDDAFRLTFNGGWTHSSTGADPNGTNAYANSNLVPSVNLTNGNSHFCIMLSENNNNNGQHGAFVSSTFGILLIPGRDLGTGRQKDSIQYDLSTRVGPVSRSTSTAAMIIGSRISTTDHRMYENGLQIGDTDTGTTSNISNVNIPLFIACRNNDGVSETFDSRQLIYTSIGLGLTETDAANLYTIVQKFQTTLGRQV